MERFFKVRQRGSSVGQEVVGGLTTFLAMAYIIAVNPTILTAAGIDFSAALTATCLGAALMTLLMGLIANRPLAMAAGMGINSIIAYSLCAGDAAIDWRVAMAIVFVEGIVILILVACGLRQAIMDAIPSSLRHAIGIGIGLFIAFIGLSGGGIIVANESTVLALGSLTEPVAIVSVVSILLTFVLYACKVPGALLISIIASVIVGIPLGVTTLPESWSFALDFSCFAAPFQTDPNTGTIALVQVFVQPALLLVVFSLMMSDFFDTLGGVMAIAEQAEFADEDGNVEDIQPILLVDSLSAAAGGFLGCSSITLFAESAAGAAAGARTGLSNVVVALLFVVFAFFSPIIGMVSSSATCGALVLVGFLMLTDVVNIDWGDVATALPAFVIIAGISFTYSITDGIGMGFIVYCVTMVATGRAREVSPLMWVVSLAFVVMFLLA